MEFKAHDYQRRAMEWIADHPRCLLFLDMGLGKTVSTLTAVQNLMFYAEVEKTLVIAPKKVAESTWSTEVEKWDHLLMTVSNVTGDARRRKAALEADADVYVIGRDSVVWLLEYLAGNKRTMPFDMVVIDELTSFKNPRSLRFKALKKMLPLVSRVVGLTGTPTPNGLLDLWGQVYCIDGGKRLGPFVTRYRDRWFNQVVRNNIPIKVWPKQGAEEEIMELISDITLTMRSEDYLTLPDMMETTVGVELGDRLLERYRKFERECVLDALEQAAGDAAKVTAAGAAALVNKLSQYANGAVYSDDRAVVEIHDEKLQALEEITESVNAPVLCFYQFQHDRDRIMERFRKLKPEAYEGEAQLRKWNEGKIRLLLAHPASTAFGLNMQAGGSTIVWFSTGWNLELYQQANARLHRQGQKYPVRVFRLVAHGTVDERMAAAIEGKEKNQTGLLKALSRTIINNNIK